MRKRDFYRECFQRAWRGKLLLAELVSGLFTILAVPLATYWPPDWGSDLNWLPLYVFAAVFVGTVIFGFLTAPYWIASEIERDRDGLRDKLDNRAARQGALNELWRLRGEGISLRNTQITSDTDFDAWLSDFEKWRLEVLGKAEVVSTNLRNWLDRLDRCNPPPKMPWPWHNSDHAHHAQIYSEILLRMQTFLEKDLKWPTTTA